MSQYQILATLVVSLPHNLPMDNCPIVVYCDEDKANVRITLDDALYGVKARMDSLNLPNPTLAFNWAVRSILEEASTAFEFDQPRAVLNDDGAVVFVVSVVLID